MQYTVPAKYRREVEAGIALMVARIALDERRASDPFPGVRALAGRNAHLLDPSATGTITITTISTEPTS